MTKLFLLLFVVLAACGGKTLDLGGYGSSAPRDAAISDGRLDVPSWPVPRQRNARSLRSDGPYLYWMADDPGESVIWRCEKRDCGGTQTAVMRRGTAGLYLGFEVRGDTLYVVGPQAILSCRASDCSDPRAIVANIVPLAVAFDDANVYWSQSHEARIFSCPLTGCAKPIPTSIVGTVALGLAVDATRLYWIAADTAYPGPPVAVLSAPKDGSQVATALADRQNQAAALTIHNGFAYWTTSFTLGTMARCPVAGCASTGPEILAEAQYYPHFVNPSDDVIFWMNGASAPDTPSKFGRPVQILSCQAAGCSSTTEVLDEGGGGGFGVRANATWNTFEAQALPAREMVVDDEAIYWFGDIVDASPATAFGSLTDASIRRTERRRAR
jgi:hypothetical protein